MSPGSEWYIFVEEFSTTWILIELCLNVCFFVCFFLKIFVRHTSTLILKNSSVSDWVSTWFKDLESFLIWSFYFSFCFYFYFIFLIPVSVLSCAHVSMWILLCYLHKSLRLICPLMFTRLTCDNDNVFLLLSMLNISVLMIFTFLAS